MSGEIPLHDLLERRALDDRHAPFCLFEDRVITFGALGTAVHSLARGFSKIGIGANSRVAVMLPNHPDHCYAVLALARLGATHVPVNIHLRETGLRHLVEDSGVDTVLAEGTYHPDVVPALAGNRPVERVIWRSATAVSGSVSGAVRTHQFDDLAAGTGEGPRLPDPDPDRVVSIMYTSGTTGAPKGVMLGEKMYHAAGRTAGVVAGVRPGDVLFLWEPLYHIAGVQAIVLCLQSGVPCALIERFSASRFWDQVRHYGATQIHYLGGVFSMLLKQPERADDARNPARIAWGAAAPAESWRRFEERFGVRVHECYGLTEGASFTTVNLAGKVGSVGRPVDHFEVRIVDDDDRPLPPAQVGEIVQREREPGLIMKGYLNNPEGTRAALRGGWLHTGDLGYRDAEGFYYFAGRKKDSIRHRGERVSAWEVEQAVGGYPGVEECAVIGVPGALGEDDIKLFVRPADGRALDPLDLIRWCEQRLAYFQVPRYVAMVEEFPKTPSQRIRKDELSRSVDDCWDRERSGHRVRRAR